MRISVIVPFLNDKRHIERCLTAPTTQDPFDGDYEILAVANGSTDGSAALARRFDVVRLLHAPMPGPYRARNVGVADAKGDVVAFTDGDCEAAPNWLRQIADAFADPGVEVVVGPRLPAIDSLALSLVIAYERAKDEYVLRDGRSDLYYASANNMAVRRRIFSELGGFVERRRGADTLFVRRVAERRTAQAVRYAPDLQVRHLEIASLRDYYAKCLQYGRSMGALDGPGRSLTSAERLSVWRRAVDREGYSALRAAAQLLALGAGAVFWTLGKASAAFTPNGRP